jgi:hypothetical protein
MALSALAQVGLQTGSRNQEDRILGKRAANREALQKFMDSRAQMGATVSPEEAMRYATELTNGGSLIYGFAPDLVSQSLVEDQNRRAQLTQEAQARDMLTNMASQEQSLGQLLPFTDDDPLTMVTQLSQKNPQLKPILDRSADKIPEMLRRKEQEAIQRAIQDPMFGAEATPENVKDLFPGYNSRVYEELAKRAGYVTEQRNQATTSRFVTQFNANKSGLTMDDDTFERNLDGLIMITAAQTNMKINKGDKLYEDIKNSILGEREKFKTEKANAALKFKSDLMTQDATFRALAAQGYNKEALDYIKGIASWHPIAKFISDEEWGKVIFGIRDGNRAIGLADTNAKIYSSVATEFDKELQLARSQLATAQYDDEEKQVANIIANAFILPADYQVIEAIKQDILDGKDQNSIAQKYQLQPMFNRDIEINKRVQNASTGMPPIGVSVEDYLQQAFNNVPLERINALKPEQREPAMSAYINSVVRNAMQIPGADRARLEAWRSNAVKQFGGTPPSAQPASPSQPAPAPATQPSPQTKPSKGRLAPSDIRDILSQELATEEQLMRFALEEGKAEEVAKHNRNISEIKRTLQSIKG